MKPIGTVERVLTSPEGSVIFLDRVKGCEPEKGQHVGYTFGGPPTCMCGAINFAERWPERKAE